MLSLFSLVECASRESSEYSIRLWVGTSLSGGVSNAVECCFSSCMRSKPGMPAFGLAGEKEVVSSGCWYCDSLDC